MRNDVKDVAFCAQGKHIVPREEMTQMLSDNGKMWRKVCQACKDATMEYRKSNKMAKT